MAASHPAWSGGPLPRCRLHLGPGEVHDQSIQRGVEPDLAAESAAFVHVERALEDIELFRTSRRNARQPFIVDEAVTRCATARTAAIGQDARHHRVDRGAHDGRSFGDLQAVLGAGRFDDGELVHGDCKGVVKAAS